MYSSNHFDRDLADTHCHFLLPLHNHHQRSSVKQHTFTPTCSVSQESAHCACERSAPGPRQAAIQAPAGGAPTSRSTEETSASKVPQVAGRIRFLLVGKLRVSALCGNLPSGPRPCPQLLATGFFKATNSGEGEGGVHLAVGGQGPDAKLHQQVSISGPHLNPDFS